VLPWTYWRAFTVVALLAAGNLFCMACPFTLSRKVGRSLGFRLRLWPRMLRSKWLAVALIVLFFWAYEVFSLWDHPLWTAYLILGYFGAAFVIDAFFRARVFASSLPHWPIPFCQFSRLALEVKVRQPDLCATCRTHECLHGTESQPGCQTHLYLPSKIGNMDCTFCLDCVRACPHENVGVLAVVPGLDVLHDRPRSSVGQLSRDGCGGSGPDPRVRAFANAALMVAPVVDWREQLVRQLEMASATPVTTAFFIASLILAPAIAVGGSVLAGRALARLTVPLRQIVARFAVALVPLGLTMWMAHLAYHLATGLGSFWPALQRASSAIGIQLGEWFARRSSRS